MGGGERVAYLSYNSSLRLHHFCYIQQYCTQDRLWEVRGPNAVLCKPHSVSLCVLEHPRVVSSSAGVPYTRDPIGSNLSNWLNAGPDRTVLKSVNVMSIIEDHKTTVTIG